MEPHFLSMIDAFWYVYLQASMADTSLPLGTLLSLSITYFAGDASKKTLLRIQLSIDERR